jgi:hypothetical protein
MQVAGDGLILAVGGVNGLPNQNHATPFINVSFGFSTKDKVQFTKYGICKTTPDTAVNPDFPSFVISSTNPNACPLSWVDNSPLGQQYTFVLTAIGQEETLFCHNWRPAKATAMRVS